MRLDMQITDEGTQHIARLTALQTLDVSGLVALTSRGFHRLAGGLRRLKR